jgi:NTE family protein
MQKLNTSSPLRSEHVVLHRRSLLGLALSSTVVLAACAAPATQRGAPAASVPIPVPALPQRKKTLALALGGGAARGFAHVGVLASLQAAGIKPDVVVGTSAGSVVGALYCAGLALDRIRTLSAELDETRLTDWSFFGRGVLKGQNLQNLVNQWVGGKLIEQFPIPFIAVASDLYSGAAKLISRGNAGLAVRASSAVPGVFEPVVIEGREFVDGGLVAPVPVRIARATGMDYVLAVDISAQPQYQATDSMAQVMLQSFAILGKSLGEHELAYADMAIRPAIGDLGSAAFESRQRAFTEGQRAMQMSIERLRTALGR